MKIGPIQPLGTINPTVAEKIVCDVVDVAVRLRAMHTQLHILNNATPTPGSVDELLNQITKENLGRVYGACARYLRAVHEAKRALEDPT